MLIVVSVCTVLALVPLLLYLNNARAYAPPPSAGTTAAVSLLIPARNEEQSIAACLDAALISQHVELEVIVLDDHSTDRTGAIVQAVAARDGRVTLVTAPPLPPDWSGKQHACFALSKRATQPLICFLDADVRLAPDALARLAAFREQSGAALVSGFPRQETGTILEQLIIPLIHFVLLGFLPLKRMRQGTDPRMGAGCGQIFLTAAEDYRTAGGHEAVKGSFHDGVQLPRAYRAQGLKTDLCDLTNLATCRMYRSAREVWRGFAKNAREGMGSPVGIWFWTVVLFVGQVMPWFLLSEVISDLLRNVMQSVDDKPRRTSDLERLWVLLLIMTTYVPRLHMAVRFRQPWLSALLHPLGVVVVLGIQWYAWWCQRFGVSVAWKGRPQPRPAARIIP
jgi:glycosyltransferase involved in cell wall biosynthesis